MMKVAGEIGALTDSCENHADDESQRVGRRSGILRVYGVKIILGCTQQPRIIRWNTSEGMFLTTVTGHLKDFSSMGDVARGNQES